MIYLGAICAFHARATEWIGNEASTTRLQVPSGIDTFPAVAVSTAIDTADLLAWCADRCASPDIARGGGWTAMRVGATFAIAFLVRGLADTLGRVLGRPGFITTFAGEIARVMGIADWL